MTQVERTNIILAKPTDLIRDNPAIFIVNHESYGRIAANFTLDEYDYPQVVRVATFSADGEEVTKLFVRDGHTRTMYISDHLEDVVLPKYPDFVFEVRDVTDSQLNNPMTVLPSEGLKDQKELTMIQYLRSVVPPTIEHSLIAPDRIAAHLINAWDNMVGHDIAERFSAIAALSILQDPNISIATERLLNQALSRQESLFIGESPEERSKIEKSLIQISSVIMQSRLIRERVAESAYILVASGSNKIGGERAAMRQIHGLLRTPVVEDRLKELPTGDKEQERTKLGQSIAEAFKRVGENLDKERLVNTFVKAVRDPKLDLAQIHQVLTSDTPELEYNNFREKFNEDQLRTAILKSKKTLELSETQTTLVRNLGRITFLDERQLTPLTRAVESAEDALNQSNRFRTKLSETREHLERSGVKNMTFVDALIAVDEAEAAILSATTPSTVSERSKRLNEAIQTAETKISWEITQHRADEIVNEVYGNQLADGIGLLAKGRIVSYIASGFQRIDANNQSLIRQRVVQLSTLDPDLQSRVVVSADIRLDAAIRIQQERNRPSLPPSPIDDPRTEKPPVISISPEIPEDSPNVPITPTADDLERVNQIEREAERIRINNTKLERLIQAFKVGFQDLDLEKGDVTPRIKLEFESLLKELGIFWFGHPDIIRVLSEDYPRLLEEIGRIRALGVQREADNNFRETRTQI